MDSWTALHHVPPSRQAIARSITQHVKYSLCREFSAKDFATLYAATSLSLRDHIMDRVEGQDVLLDGSKQKRIYTLSIEYLLGRSLTNNLINLGMYSEYKAALETLGVDLGAIEESESDAALGNGGLGRLAACFLDSMATLGIPGTGYGLHYEYGLFKQEIENGYQKEKPDHWRSYGYNPWEIWHPETVYLIPIRGHIEETRDRDGNYNPMWLDWKVLLGVPYDIPIVGYGGRTINSLRLFAAHSSNDFDISVFNTGDFIRAVEQKISAENISKILYPSDAIESGRELRLMQEYFLVSCALRDVLRQYKSGSHPIEELHQYVAIQMNDTHPALAVPELIRLLVDEHGMPIETAWEITRKTLAYTNHTVMPEALERWPISLMEQLLPRHLQIIYDLNLRFLGAVAKLQPLSTTEVQSISLIDDSTPKHIRMANLAIAGSHRINGVSRIHTEILKKHLFPVFYKLFPGHFYSITNGITPRRWIMQANPKLATLLTQTIGDGWIKDLAQLSKLESFAADPDFHHRFTSLKREAKSQLTKHIFSQTRINVNPEALFDIQAKRFHEYKRQLLNVLNIIYRYLLAVDDGILPEVPRVYIFAGKAAPGYLTAKILIKLIHNIGSVINHDPRVKDLIKVVFLPNYSVSRAELIIPAADISEQISTAGMEASGTGNMKFALNGAVTIGTLDGANIEIRDAVGSDNFYHFGLTVEDIEGKRTHAELNPSYLFRTSTAIQRTVDALYGNRFCPGEPQLFREIAVRIHQHYDPYFHLADFLSYTKAQDQITADFQNQRVWTKKAISNIARIGFFSSDRAIQEYKEHIWGEVGHE